MICKNCGNKCNIVKEKRLFLVIKDECQCRLKISKFAVALLSINSPIEIEI